MQKFRGILALTRWTEIYDYVIAETLLAAVFAGVEWNWRILLIFFASFLAQCFMFMINDVEDAEDDATNPKKLKRNPISNGTLSKKEGYIYTALTGILAVLLAALVAIGSNPLAVTLVTVSGLFIGFLYSWKKVRLKSVPLFDVLSHMYMLAGAPYLLAYFAFTSELSLIGLLGFLIVMIVSGYGVIENQLRDYETDRKTNIRNTTSVIGFKAAKLLRYFFIISAIVLILLYISTLPQQFLVLVQVGAIAIVLLIYPIVKYLITRDRQRLKLDLHRVMLFIGYAALLAKILHII